MINIGINRMQLISSYKICKSSTNYVDKNSTVRDLINKSISDNSIVKFGNDNYMAAYPIKEEDGTIGVCMVYLIVIQPEKNSSSELSEIVMHLVSTLENTFYIFSDMNIDINYVNKKCVIGLKTIRHIKEDDLI